MALNRLPSRLCAVGLLFIVLAAKNEVPTLRWQTSSRYAIFQHILDKHILFKTLTVVLSEYRANAQIKPALMRCIVYSF